MLSDKGAHNRGSGVFLVLSCDLALRHWLRYRNRAVEIIRVSSPEARDLTPRLRPGRCMFGVRVHHASDFRKSLVQNQVRRKIRGRAQISFENIPIQVGQHQVLRLHFLVRHATGLDHHQPVFTRNSAGIAKCVQHQSAPNQLKVGLKHFFAQTLE